MSNSDPSRLDRIEALVESNARAIEALSASDAEGKKERARLYELVADVAQAQAYLAQAQADTKKEMYRLMSNFEQQNQELSRRQGEIVDILKVLVNKESNH